MVSSSQDLLELEFTFPIDHFFTYAILCDALISFSTNLFILSFTGRYLLWSVYPFHYYVGNTNILSKSMSETPTQDTFFRHTFPTCFFTKEEEVLSHPFPFYFYLLIPATFCCTHSPILRRKCSSIFIPLMVNRLMKSYAFSSFALKLRFSAFSS